LSVLLPIPSPPVGSRHDDFQALTIAERRSGAHDTLAALFPSQALLLATTAQSVFRWSVWIAAEKIDPTIMGSCS
jgi:hypothetical protein